MVSIYFQPNLKELKTTVILFLEELSLVKKYHNVTFIAAIMFSASYLPYGKFFNRLGGNIATLFSFLFILYFLLVSLNWYYRLVSNVLATSIQGAKLPPRKIKRIKMFRIFKVRGEPNFTYF